ncbi:hypothetical protein UlMin_035770 [Ulmus minor]
MREENNGENHLPNRALKYCSIPNVRISSIRRPAIQANNFTIKPAIIQMIQSSVQFGGLANDDPNLHIANFLEICDSFKHNGVSDDAIRLRLFPFSLQNKANACGGALMNKTSEEGYELIEVMASNNYMKPTNRSAQRRAGIHDINTINNLAA